MISFLRNFRFKSSLAASHGAPFKYREAAYQASKQLKNFDRHHRLSEAVFAVLGTESHHLWTKPGKITFYRRQGLPVLQESDIRASHRHRLSRLALVRPEAWNTLIAALARRGLAEEAFKVYRKMLARRVQPSAQTFTSLFEACSNRLAIHPPHPDIPPAKIEVYQRALTLFESMKEKQVQMNRIHVNALMKCCSRARDWEKLFELYKMMNRAGSSARKGGIKSLVSNRNRRAVTAAVDEQALQEGMLLRGESARNDMSWINDRFQEYLSPGKALVDKEENEIDDQKETLLSGGDSTNSALTMIRPDCITYSTLLSACARRGGEAAFDDAMKLWAEIKKDAAESETQLLSKRETFIRSQHQSLSNKNGSVGRGRKKVEELSEEEFGEVRLAEKLMADAEEMFPMIQIDADMVHSLLFTCKNAKKRSSIEKGLEIAQHEFGPAFNFTLFDQYLATSADYADEKHPFLSLFPTLPKLNSNSDSNLNIRYDIVSANPKSLTIMMDVLDALGIPKQMLQQFYQFMTSPSAVRHYSTIKPDAISELHYIRTIIESDPEQVLKRIDQLRKKHGHLRKSGDMTVKPTLPLDVYHCAFQACAQLSDVKRALAYWKELKDVSHRFYSDANRGYRPTHESVIAWLNCLIACKQPLEAVDFIQKLIKFRDEAKNVERFTWWHSLAMESLVNNAVLKRALKACDMLMTIRHQMNENPELKYRSEFPVEEQVKNVPTKNEIRKLKELLFVTSEQEENPEAISKPQENEIV